MERRYKERRSGETCKAPGARRRGRTFTGAPQGFVGSDAGATLSVPTGAVFRLTGAGFQWTGGTITGNGPLTNDSLFVITGAEPKFISNGGTLRNAGRVVWDGGAVTVPGGRIVNAGVYDLTGSGIALSGPLAGWVVDVDPALSHRFTTPPDEGRRVGPRAPPAALASPSATLRARHSRCGWEETFCNQEVE